MWKFSVVNGGISIELFFGNVEMVYEKIFSKTINVEIYCY